MCNRPTCSNASFQGTVLKKAGPTKKEKRKANVGESADRTLEDGTLSEPRGLRKADPHKRTMNKHRRRCKW